MTAEKKKGYALRDWQAHEEAKLLEGFPAWDAWKNSLFGHLKNKGIFVLNSGVEEVLHEFYVLRREIQLSRKTSDDADAFHELLDKEHPEIFDKPGVIEAFRFISDKTQKLKP